MSDWWSEFLAFAPNTAAGDWAWVALSWLVTFVGLGGYLFMLARRRRKLNRE